MEEKKWYFIFDLDGTLLNTLEDLTDSMNTILELYHFPLRTIDEIRSFVGNGVRKLVERAIPAEHREDASFVDRLYKEFSLHYNKNCSIKTDLYPGIKDLIHRLIHDYGYACAIVSNKIDSAVKELAKHYFGEDIPVAIGELPERKAKPHPEMIELAMKELGAVRERTVYIGDSEVDIETAKNSGLPCISVLWGFRDKEFLERQGGKFFVNEPSEIEGLILKWIKI